MDGVEKNTEIFYFHLLHQNTYDLLSALATKEQVRYDREMDGWTEDREMGLYPLML